jgi:hypothetical protein
MSTVGELFRTVPFGDVVAALKALYVDIDEPSYRAAWDRIVMLEPTPSDLVCEIRRVLASEWNDEAYVDVHGLDADGQAWAIEFRPWSEWLSMPLKVSGLDLTPAQALAHILWEMTFVEYDQDTIQDEWSEIRERAEAAKRGELS